MTLTSITGYDTLENFQSADVDGGEVTFNDPGDIGVPGKSLYAVVATGPAYSFDLESDLDELERLLNFVRQGSFPASNKKLISLLGGSYSGLHVQHLLQRVT